MKPCSINGRYDVVLPDHLAEWDALSGWERDRFADMEDRLRFDDVLWDVGTEHGALSVVYAGWVGGMVLIEPEAAMWRNIRQTWEANDRRAPLATWVGLVGPSGRDDDDGYERIEGWPAPAWEPGETPGMAYRYLHEPGHDATPRTTLDRLCARVGHRPTAITMDVEGAEVAALTGARTLLERDRPTVWVSVHPDLMERDYGTSPEALHELMDRRGYDGTLLGVDHEHHWRYDPRPA